MLVHENEDYKIYRAACDCISHECDMTIELEICPPTNFLILSLDKKLKWSSQWSYDYERPIYSWFVDKWKRITVALKILFTGYIEVEDSFLMKDNDHIDAFIDAIRNGQQLLNERVAKKNVSAESGVQSDS